jgi:2-dehydropantoate 2-reductase
VGGLAQCLADDGLAITLQNGLGNYETLTQRLGLSRVVLGTTTTGATLLGPGLARAGGEGIISIQRHQAVGPIDEALASAGFQTQIVQDAKSLVWGKLVINAAINPLTAILRVQNGELLERTPARDLMRALATEAAQVALVEKITLPFSDAVSTVEDVARKTAQNHSSMLQDVLRNAPTEIDAINGAVVQTAQKHNLETPVNWVCWKLVKALTL